MKFQLGFMMGGLVSALLSGKPAPSSPIGRFWAWVESSDEGGEGLTLSYFDVRGRGEAIRIALADRALPFKEVSFTGAQWGKGSPDGLKARMSHKLMFGQVPLVEVDGLQLVQSHSIFRYLAAKHGWYDSLTAAEAARVDMAAEGTEDVRKQLTAVKYSDDYTEDEKRQKYADWCIEGSAGRHWLGFYERLLVQNPPGTFVAGTKEPSHADYLLFDLLDSIEVLAPEHAPRLLNTQPRLKAWRKRMGARPNIAAYLEGPGRRAA